MALSSRWIYRALFVVSMGVLGALLIINKAGFFKKFSEQQNQHELPQKVSDVSALPVFSKTASPHASFSPNLERLNDFFDIVPVAIIGSGPAGLSAALYTSRMNMHTVLFQGPAKWGQLMGTGEVENWPGLGTKRGPVLMEDLARQASQFGAYYSSDTIERVDFSTWPYTLWTDDGVQVHAATVIIATGSSPRLLHIEGEDLYWGRGVSTCAVCDAPFYKEKQVAVVGGGDSAAEEALELAQVAKKVTLYVRGDKLRASAIMQKRLFEHANITIEYNTQVAGIYGDDTHVTNIAVTYHDKAGKKEREEKVLVDGIFLGIGHEPNSRLFRDQVLCDTYGYIILADRTQATSVPGVFAAGDIADYKYRQAGVAAGDGIKAALDAVSFLREHGFNEQVEEKHRDHLYDPTVNTVRQELLGLEKIEDLDKYLEQQEKTIVLDFYAPYCPSCMNMIPLFEAVAGRLRDKVIILKVDVSEMPELGKRFGISSVPTLAVFKKGKEVARSQAVMTKRQMLEYLEQYL